MLAGATFSSSYDHHSLQAGDPKKISKLTNIDVFSDFRNKNIAEGCRGAPLIPDFHKYIFSETGKRKLIINIGGISNGTYLDGEKIAAASDIGPGNCLLDFVMTSSQLGDYDKDGQIASNGTINNLIKDVKKELLKFPKGHPTEYAIYPKNLSEIYFDRRFRCEEDMYSILNIKREEKEKRREQFRKNFELFGAREFHSSVYADNHSNPFGPESIGLGVTSVTPSLEPGADLVMAFPAFHQSSDASTESLSDTDTNTESDEEDPTSQATTSMYNVEQAYWAYRNHKRLWRRHSARPGR